MVTEGGWDSYGVLMFLWRLYTYLRVNSGKVGFWCTNGDTTGPYWQIKGLKGDVCCHWEVL